MKRYVVILYLILFFCSMSVEGTEIKNQVQKDELLQYIYDSFKDNKNDGMLKVLIKYYDKIGLFDESLELLSKLSDENIKALSLNSLLFLKEPRADQIFERIEKEINSLNSDNSLKVSLYTDLIKAYAKNGSSTKVLTTYQKYKDIINKEMDNDNEDSIDHLFQLYAYFHQVGLKEECEKISKAIDDKIERLLENKKDSPQLIGTYEFLMYSFSDTEQNEKAMIYKNKILEIIRCETCKVEFSQLGLLEYFIVSMEFENASMLAEKIVKAQGIQIFRENTSNFLLNSLPSLFALNQNLKNIFMENIEGLGDTGIELLLEMNEWSKAKAIAGKMDIQKGDSEYIDAYYFHIGKRYISAYPNRWIMLNTLSIVKRINDSDKRVTLMLEIADYFKERGEDDVFLNVLDEVKKGLKDNDFLLNHELEVMKNSFSYRYLKADYFNKAIELINKKPGINSELYTQSNELYLAGDFFVSNCNKKKAMEIFNHFSYNSYYKGLLLSKIASLEYRNGNEKEAMSLFKKAVDLIKTNEEEKVTGLVGVQNVQVGITSIFIDYANLKYNKNFTLSDF